METLRQEIDRTVKELNALLMCGTLTEIQESQIRESRDFLLKMWVALLNKQLSENIGLYKQAIDELNASSEEAVKAREDIAVIEHVISKAASAAKSVDLILRIITGSFL